LIAAFFLALLSLRAFITKPDIVRPTPPAVHPNVIISPTPTIAPAIRISTIQ
jgi:hypothetical protein